MKKPMISALLAVLLLSSSGVWAEDQKFNINRFDIQGNTLLSAEEVDQAVLPYAGEGRVYGDIQKALSALESAYRAKGYGAVQVNVPEQELTAGVVRFSVMETTVGKVTVVGNQFFTTENIRESIPQLKEGTAPNLRQVSENVQLANESPAKQVEVTLGASDQPGNVDVKVAVVDENPRKYIVTFDNTGEEKTGQHRLGLSYRDSNLFGHDETLTLGYMTSPDSPRGVDVDVVSVGVRLPFYQLGDSLDIVFGASNVNIPSNIVAPGSPISLNGKGKVLSLHWNHLFPREGEYTSRLIFGWDFKSLENACGKVVGAGCVAMDESLLSVTYSGQWLKPGMAWGFNVGLTGNSPFLANRSDEWRFNYAANARETDENFMILKGGASFLAVLPGDWQAKAAINAQYALNSALPTAEQFNLAGQTAVRGFGERVLTADSGFVANIEGYTPDLMPLTGVNVPGVLRALAFYDFGYGASETGDGDHFYDPVNKLTVPAGKKLLNETTTLASIGLGLRYNIGKDISAHVDWARVLESSPANRSRPNSPMDDQWRVHFGVSVGF